MISFDCSIIAAYSAGAHARQRHAVLALAALLVANLVDAFGAPGNRAGDVALAVVVFSLVPWLVGQALRRERSTHREDCTSSPRNSRPNARDGRREAVTAERGRIARELHDIVAHAISVIAVQADAATKLLRHDPGRAREPLETIQATARGALAEMRQLVGLLRETRQARTRRSSRSPGSPTSNGSSTTSSDPGCRSRSRSTASDRPLPATLDLAAYRIVQEGLTNVRKHAGAAARAGHASTTNPIDLDIVVRDNGRPLPHARRRQATGSSGCGNASRSLAASSTAGPAGDGGFVLQRAAPARGHDR